MNQTLDRTILNSYLLTAVQAALQAGSEIMRIYSGAHYKLEYKMDDSPLTEADQRAHEIITKSLQQSALPVLSEEGRDIPYAERRHWNRLWIVDPLDGTKEFLKKNGEFTVNIALIQDHRPCLGVIYAPDLQQLYFGGPDYAAYTCHLQTNQVPHTLQNLLSGSDSLPLPQTRSSYVIMASRSHLTQEVQTFAESKKQEHPKVAFISAGSSLKICRVAEGSADVYPRLGPTMEWDTAAGQAIAEGAGKKLTVWSDGHPLRYNREHLLNPWFMVS